MIWSNSRRASSWGSFASKARPFTRKTFSGDIPSPLSSFTTAQTFRCSGPSASRFAKYADGGMPASVSRLLEDFGGKGRPVPD
jgi:hypothetical protein